MSNSSTTSNDISSSSHNPVEVLVSPKQGTIRKFLGVLSLNDRAMILLIKFIRD
jgi:hypothetical protein